MPRTILQCREQGGKLCRLILGDLCKRHLRPDLARGPLDIEDLTTQLVGVHRGVHLRRRTVSNVVILGGLALDDAHNVALGLLDRGDRGHEVQGAVGDAFHLSKAQLSVGLEGADERDGHGSQHVEGSLGEVLRHQHLRRRLYILEVPNAAAPFGALVGVLEVFDSE
jgi:hypothetical protein